MNMTVQAFIIIGTGVIFVLLTAIAVIDIIRTPSKKNEYPYNGRQE